MDSNALLRQSWEPDYMILHYHNTELLRTPATNLGYYTPHREGKVNKDKQLFYPV